jgi:hypothetical protein
LHDILNRADLSGLPSVIHERTDLSPPRRRDFQAARRCEVASAAGMTAFYEN